LSAATRAEKIGGGGGVDSVGGAAPRDRRRALPDFLNV